MIAPLRSPSMDSELPTAMSTCGCAGTATVSGYCAMDTVGGAVARTGAGALPTPARISTAIEASASSRRPKRCGCIVTSAPLVTDDLHGRAGGAIAARGVRRNAAHVHLRPAAAVAAGGTGGAAPRQRLRHVLDHELRLRGGRRRGQ